VCAGPGHEEVSDPSCLSRLHAVSSTLHRHLRNLHHPEKDEQEIVERKQLRKLAALLEVFSVSFWLNTKKKTNVRKVNTIKDLC